ncbi:unnamed protein product [Closterium sp. NIES-64]|nr:unnamed protein product [Closterium sp. NIES-64]
MPPSNYRRPNAAPVSPHEHHDPAASPPSASAVLMATDADVAAASPYGDDPQKAAAAAMAMTSPCPLLPGAKAAAAATPSVFCFHSICYSVNLGRKKSLIRRCIEPCVGLAAKRKSTQFTSISDDEAKASAPPKIRVILNEISGFARSGEVLAIMGSSGCGKTTLLDVLSHRIASAAASAGPLAGGRTGYIELGDKPTTDDLMRRISAYVMQDDLMYATLTARETLMFSAEMNLPRSFSYKEKQERVERLLELLSLQHAANTLIGNENLRGVSGGERKRVAIGAHIVHDPKILFLDEPTSGLDSSNAYRVVKILKDIALTSESIVIMVIHQPSFRVLEQIDQLLMLSTGNMIFFGPPPHLPAFFDAFGTPVPKFANPTEFALELLEQLKSTSEAALMELVAFAADWHRSRDHMAHAKTGRHAKPALLAAPGGGGDGEETDSGGGGGAGAHGRKGADGKKKFCGLAGKLGKKGGKKGEEDEEEEVVESGHKGTHRYANSWFREFYILFVRSGLMIIRNPLLYFLRLMLLTVAGFLLASLFYKPSHDPQGMLERLAYLSFIVAMLFFCSADATPIFIMERNIFIRETSHNTYRASTYVAATMAVYIPLQALMAMTLTLESWWTVGLSGGFPGALFFATICFLCLFTGNAIATFASSFFKNMILAYATVISTMAYFTLVSGFYIHRTSIPKFWIWLHYISPMKYAFEALVQNEFVRDSGPCYLTLNGAFDIQPISTYVNTTRLKPALMSFLPNVVTPGVGPLTSQSCIMTGTFISRKYLDIVELTKYQSMAVLFSMAISLLGGIGAGCPKLETLKLVSVRDPRFQINAAAWRKLARQCPIDPCELHALSRSFHTLTHLALHDCPLVSSHSLAALTDTNPALSSLSLHSTSYPLFAAQGLRQVLRASPSRLHTLTLSGLPAFRPGTLARCSGLKRLTLRGRGEAKESVSPSESPQEPSLEGLVALLVHVEERGDGGGGVEQRGCFEGTKGGVDATTARQKLLKAISEARQTPRMHGESALVNIRRAVILVRAAMSFCRCVRLAVVHVDGRMAREAALKNAGSAAESAGFFTSAADYETEERERERQGREGGGGGREVEELVGFVPESDLPADLVEISETLLGEQTGEWPAFVAVSREDARRLLHVLRDQLDAHMESFIDAFEGATPIAVIWGAAAPGAPIAVPPPVPGAAAPVAAAAAHGAAGAAAHVAVVDGAAAHRAAADGAAADGAAADGVAADGAAADGAAADGVAAEGAAAQELTSAEAAGGPVGDGASTEGAAQQLQEAESGGGQHTADEQTREDKQLGSRSPTHTPLKGRTTPNKSISEKQTFESLARAAVFGRLKSFALLNCRGLGEGQLVRLLCACGMLEDLRVEGSDAF